MKKHTHHKVFNYFVEPQTALKPCNIIQAYGDSTGKEPLIDLQSIKLWLNSFGNQGHSSEAVLNVLFTLGVNFSKSDNVLKFVISGNSICDLPSCFSTSSNEQTS